MLKDFEFYLFLVFLITVLLMLTNKIKVNPFIRIPIVGHQAVEQQRLLQVLQRELTL